MAHVSASRGAKVEKIAQGPPSLPDVVDEQPFARDGGPHLVVMSNEGLHRLLAAVRIAERPWFERAHELAEHLHPRVEGRRPSSFEVISRKAVSEAYQLAGSRTVKTTRESGNASISSR